MHQGGTAGVAGRTGALETARAYVFEVKCDSNCPFKTEFLQEQAGSTKMGGSPGPQPEGPQGHLNYGHQSPGLWFWYSPQLGGQRRASLEECREVSRHLHLPQDQRGLGGSGLLHMPSWWSLGEVGGSRVQGDFSQSSASGPWRGALWRWNR